MVRSKRWLVSPPITAAADENLASFPPILRQLLFNRGYADNAEATAFLAAELNIDTDPDQLTGMAMATDRIRFALIHQEPIAIYGDYDVDGVTATAVLVEVLRALGGTVRPYIPNRFDEGYGLNNEALDVLKAEGAKLVITVDCGIRSPAEAQHSRDIRLDLIISDHHHPSEGVLPLALAVINPRQADDAYPDKNLAGVGIAFKIAQALTADRRLENGTAVYNLAEVLDLVALGTVADLAPLIGENRVLVRQGLQQLRETRRQGLFSLANVAQMTISKATASQLGFILGPRLNAAGRLKSAEAALELLTTTDLTQAGKLAQALEGQNRERQALTRAIQKKAEELATAEVEKPILLFAVDEGFNAGVIGLAASRLSEIYYRPAIVASRGPEETRGSCRSIPEFHITDALDRCADLLVRHGGHAGAAGFTVRNQNLTELMRRLTCLAEAQLGSEELRPTLVADMEVRLSALDFDLLHQLADLEPTGYGNREAAFVSRGAKVRSSRAVGADGGHLKLTLEDERGATIDAIGFRLGHLKATLPPRVDVLYSLESNDYNGRTTLQLNLRDVRAPGNAD